MSSLRAKAMKLWGELTKNFPNVIVLIVAVGCTTLAIIDKSYREEFTRNFAQNVVVGYWAWSQAATKEKE